MRMATVGGARACGLDTQIGAIEVGRKADVVIHSATRPEMNPPINRLKNLIHSGRSKSVATVIVDGELVLLAGAFVRLDERAIVDKARRASSALLQRMGV